MQYDVIVRTKQGFLAYEFRINLEDMETNKLYQSVISNPEYKVQLKPVK